jgi:hypothetical protein
MSLASPATKVDLSRERRRFFTAPRQPELVELPEAAYLVVDGRGEPGGEIFRDRIGSLYAVAYTIKMTAKREGRDFKVPTFEASWWIETNGTELPPREWRWQLLMMLPDFVNEAAIDEANLALAGRKPGFETDLVRFQRITQGACVQVLHIGPYDTEDGSIRKMHAFMEANGLRAAGPHHEVYLGDPNRSKPEALKTILRQRVERTE